MKDCAFNLKKSLDVYIRDEPSSQITDPQLDNNMICNRFSNIPNLIDKVPFVSNKTLVSCITYLDKVNPNNGNSKPDLVSKRKESQYITIYKKIIN